MYYCDNSVLTDVEDLLYDFLCYRKNKKQNEIKLKTVPFCAQSLIEDVDFDVENVKRFPDPICYKEADNEYLNFAMSELSRELNTIIDEVLNEYEYDGSPIFEDQIDRETLAQIISKVVDLAIERIDELKDIKMEPETQNIGFRPYSILQSLIEALIINNIFLKRKPVHKNFNNFMPY